MVDALTKRLSDKSYCYINEPIPLNAGDYDHALKAFLDRFKKCRNVKSIYKYGSVSSPGISDLDFIVILDDPLRRPGKRLSYKGFTPKQKYICSHPPVYVNEYLFQNLAYIMPFQNLERIYGKSFDQIIPKNKDINDLLLTMEMCTLFYPRVFFRLLFAPKFDVRRALLLTNALRYPMNLIHAYIPRDRRFKDFERRVNELRRGWFQLKREKYEDLVRLVIEAVYLSIDIMRKIAGLLQSSGYVKKTNMQNGQVGGEFARKFYMFVQDLNENQMIDRILKDYDKTPWPKRFISILPTAFLVPLLYYREQEGPLSEHLRKNLKVSDGFQPEVTFKKEVFKRIHFLNALINFLENNNVSPNGAHIYYGYWPRVGIKSRLVHYAMKLGLI